MFEVTITRGAPVPERGNKKIGPVAVDPYLALEKMAQDEEPEIPIVRKALE